MNKSKFRAEISRIEGNQRTAGDVDSMIEGIHAVAGSKRKGSTNKEAGDQPQNVDMPNQKQVETGEPVPVPETVTMTKDQLDAVINGVVQGKQAESDRKLEESQRQAESAQAEVERVTKAADKERSNHETLATFLRDYGVSPGAIGGTPQHPQAAGITFRHVGEGMHSEDAFKEFSQIYDQSQCASIQSIEAGTIEQRDVRQVDNWIKEHGRKMIPAIDNFARKHGLLRGQEAATTRADLPGLFLEVLSSFVRITHSPAHIWHNFPDVKVDLGKKDGETVDLVRFAYAASRRNQTDWDLGSVAALNTTPQALKAGISKVTVQEFGMGKPGLPGDTNAPISLNMFLSAISVMDLLPVINQVLGYNYREFETTNILDGKFAQTALKFYNKKGAITEVAADLVAADGGQCTYQFLRSVAAEMSRQGIPSYANGKYVLVLGQQELSSLEASLEPRLQVLSRMAVAELTQIFEQSNNNSDLNYNGYKGDLGDFMIFCTGTVYQGPFAGLQETITGSLKDIHVGYAFGAHAIGRGKAMPFSIYEADDRDFGRNRKLLWRSYEGFGALDIHPILDPVGTPVPQQTRVIELRFTAKPL